MTVRGIFATTSQTANPPRGTAMPQLIEFTRTVSHAVYISGYLPENLQYDTLNIRKICSVFWLWKTFGPYYAINLSLSLLEDVRIDGHRQHER